MLFLHLPTTLAFSFWLIVFSVLLLASSVFDFDDDSVFKNEVKIILPPTDIYIAEDMPEYPGGEEALFKDLRKNIMPCSRVGVSGKIFVDFRVDKNGNVTDVKIKRGIHSVLDKNAIEAVLKLKKWSVLLHFLF